MALSLDVTWTVFKAKIPTGVQMSYADIDGNYFLSGSTSAANYTCRIAKDGGSDQTDFENNFKSTATSLT